jgi:hypothetical protein
MPTHNREQRQILLEHQYGRFRCVLSFKETDDDGTKLGAEYYISKQNIHSWKILENLLDKYSDHIMSVRFDDDKLQVRYLCQQTDMVFCNLFDYIVYLYEGRQE